MSKFVKFLRNPLVYLEDKLYADSVREEAMLDGVSGKDLDEFVREAVFLRHILRATYLGDDDDWEEVMDDYGPWDD